MKLIVGLGNPGSQYANTRHNIGFMVADTFAHDIGADFKIWGQGKICELAQGQIGNEKVLILKPLTFMNDSGFAVVMTATFFKILPEDICAIHDDLDLPFNNIRLKVGGGDGGHNGLKSMTKSLNSSNYGRVRIGIGRPPHPDMETADYVLGAFSRDEDKEVDGIIDRSIDGIKAFCSGPESFLKEMNVLNRKD